MTSTLSNGSQEMPVNLLTIYVGPPTTGKSQALKECAVSPIPLSAKIYDVLFKLLKFDEENATRNIQVLWQLFSGEQSSYWYATESTREIFHTTFCIVGSTQVPFTARLITEGPRALLAGPSPHQTEQALQYLKTSPITGCDNIFIKIKQLHSNRTTYCLTEDTSELIKLIHWSQCSDQWRSFSS